ncbi:hypothetical protein B0T10DRAFT_562622 [Thelonectria olida]|uniref:Uncharacterized protein n=1 Tax=Thelonectria olida TaxID=1576542 RepID=A0A9P8W3T0_9HYPO|nr:hypothetical protein B0T10DRAFT_562622 [Thelonectria olida]
MATLTGNQNTTATSADSEGVDTGGLDGVDVELQISVARGPYGAIHEPIHESLALGALISSNSGVSPGTTVKNASNHDWEYIHGAIWNDDPECQLFGDSPGRNHSYSTGGTWLLRSTDGKSQWNPNDLNMKRMRNPIGHSHYGDLQFFQCMASNRGEDPEITKAKVMLAIGEDGITPNTEVAKTKLIQFCPVRSLPPRYMPLTCTLAIDSRFQGFDIRRRALGSILHIIQDSYAIGHTRRALLNKEDKISDNPLQFKPGATDRWGAIVNFYTDFGQNGDLHANYDHENDGIPDPENLGNLDQ